MILYNCKETHGIPTVRTNESIYETNSLASPRRNYNIE
jgi:hypothetical protein